MFNYAIFSPETTLRVIHMYIIHWYIINLGQAGNAILNLYRKICYFMIMELLVYP